MATTFAYDANDNVAQRRYLARGKTIHSNHVHRESGMGTLHIYVRSAPGAPRGYSCGGMAHAYSHAVNHPATAEIGTIY
jgi:hypothetical protein